LVVSDKIQEYNKTKQAVLFLRRSKIWADVLKVSNRVLMFIPSILSFHQFGDGFLILPEIKFEVLEKFVNCRRYKLLLTVRGLCVNNSYSFL
jgi:hypothetical protein